MSASQSLTVESQYRAMRPVSPRPCHSEPHKLPQGLRQQSKPSRNGAKNSTEARLGQGKAGCVAVIDPDAVYRKAMASCLRMKGFDVVELPKADAYCVEALSEAKADAALISSDALEAVGVSVLQALRTLNPGLQFAVVTDQVNQSIEREMLDAGAADVFDRRRSSAIVTQRLILLVEGARGVCSGEPDGEEAMHLGKLTLRLQSHRALWEAQEVPLTVTEFRIVRLLATSGEGGASYREIYDMVHGAGFKAGDGPDGYRTNVRSLIRRIRAKFRRLAPATDVIENLPAKGYRWRPVAAKVERVSTRPSRAPLQNHAEMGAAG